MNVLFCCHGNVNRSPAGEIICREKQPEYVVKSCGVGPGPFNKITAKKMRETLSLSGYDYTEIRSQEITEELVSWADVIFYMDKSNSVNLEKRFGLEVFKKAILLSSLLGVPKIPDPAFATGTELHFQVITMIERALAIWTLENLKIDVKPLSNGLSGV